MVMKIFRINVLLAAQLVFERIVYHYVALRNTL